MPDAPDVLSYPAASADYELSGPRTDALGLRIGGEPRAPQGTSIHLFDLVLYRWGKDKLGVQRVKGREVPSF